MKKYKSILACTLAFLLIFVNGSISQNVSAQDPKDVSSRMTISAYNMKLIKTPIQDIIVKGVLADPVPNIHVGDTIAFDVQMGIVDTENPTRILAGDYIEIPLPEGFNFYAQIENHSTIGTPSIETREGRQYYRFTFNEEIEKRSAVENAWYKNIKGGVKEGVNHVDVGFAGEPIPLKILPKKVDEFGSNTWGIWENGDHHFLKEGVSIYASDAIEWNLWANFRALKQDMEKGVINPDDQLDDLVIVDYLPAGFDIAPEDPTAPIPKNQADKTLVLAMATVYAPTASKVGENGTHLLTDSFAVSIPVRLPLEDALRSNNGESLEDFIKRVNETNNQKTESVPGAGNRTLGVYTHKATFVEKTRVGGQTVNVEFEATQHVVVVAFGSVAKDGGATYDGVYAMLNGYSQHKELKDAIANHEKANQEQKDVMLRTYSNGKPIHAWRLLVNTKFPEAKKSLYTNKAEMRTGKNPVKIDNETKDTQYVKAEAGADGSLVLAVVPVKKTWDVVEDVPAGTTVVAELYADDAPTGKTLELSAAGNWEGTFSGLDKYKAVEENGRTKYVPIVYSVKEQKLHGYAEAHAEIVNGVYNLHNTKNADDWTTIRIRKLWEKADPKEYENLTITAEIERKIGNVSEVVKTVELNKKNGWQAAVSLLKTTETNEPIEYTVKEINPPKDFESKVKYNPTEGFVITNTKASAAQPTPTPSVPDTTARQPETSGAQPDSTSAQQDSTSAAVSTTTNADGVPPTTIFTTTTLTTTAIGTADIDENDPARGGVTTTTTETANIDDDEAARGGVTTTTSKSDGGTLPHTGNLPNELFYMLGAFVTTLGVLVLMLQRLKK